MTTSKKRKKIKGWIIAVIVILLIAAVSIIAGWYLSGGKTETAASEKPGKSIPPAQAVKTPLDGTWVSEYDGAILTINGLSFSLELPSVDKQVLVAGTIRIHEQTAILKNISAHAICKSVEGKYKFSLKDGQLSFKLVTDECAGRKERMTASWFRL